MGKSKKLLVLNVAVVTAILQGCATTKPQSGMQLELEEMRKAVEEKEQLITARDQKIRELEAAPATSAIQSQPASANDTLLPPHAKPGECYARVWVPATYSTVSKTVLTKEASERTETTPARYEWAEERVMTTEASSRLEKIPAVYATENESIKVREASRTWRTSLKRDAPPASPEILKAARNSGINLDAATAGMCFHEHYRPARYETESQQVLLSEASEDFSVSSPKYRMVEKRILVKDASFTLKEIPAIYDWDEERIIDKPAHTEWQKGTGPIQRIDESTGEIMCLVEVPATYRTT